MSSVQSWFLTPTASWFFSQVSRVSQFCLPRCPRSVGGANSQFVMSNQMSVKSVSAVIKHDRQSTVYQYTSRQISLPSGGESAWRYKETRGVISQGRREMPPLYPTKPCFEHALLGFNLSLVVFNKYKRIERSSAGPDKYNLWLQLIFSVHTFVQSFCCQCFVYFCYSFVTINHFNSDFHYANISYEVSLYSVTKARK